LHIFFSATQLYGLRRTQTIRRLLSKQFSTGASRLIKTRNPSHMADAPASTILSYCN
jgi:hypothetical protein